MGIDTEQLINGIRNGTIRPSKVGTRRTRDGKLMTFYKFPEYKRQIHIHFDDEKREQILPSKIKSFSRDKKDDVWIDNYTLALLRHFAEEQSEYPYPTPKKLWEDSRMIVAIFLVIVVSTFIFIAVQQAREATERPERETRALLDMISESCMLRRIMRKNEPIRSVSLLGLRKGPDGKIVRHWPAYKSDQYTPVAPEEIVDGWGNLLMFEYQEGTGEMIRVTSAGPDGRFRNSDDIVCKLLMTRLLDPWDK